MVPCTVEERASAETEVLVLPKQVDGFGCTCCGGSVLPAREGHCDDAAVWAVVALAAAAEDANAVVGNEIIRLGGLLRPSQR